MRTTHSERLADDARLVDGLTGSTNEDLAAAVDRIACRLLEHVTGIEQAPTHRTGGPLPVERLAAIEKLELDHRNDGRNGLAGVTLSPRLAGAIAIQLADYAETLHHLKQFVH